jgi:preprotein translocase subunit YajC
MLTTLIAVEQAMGTWIFLMDGGGGGLFDGPLGMILPIAAIILVFYFLMMRPQKKERDRLKTMLENLRKSDEVVTAGGIHGKVAGIKGDLITLRVDDNKDVKIRVSRTSIIGITRKDGEEVEEGE